MEISALFQTSESGVAQVVLERERQRVTAGTAFLVQGGVVTNSHVIRAAGADVIGLRFSGMDDGQLIRIAHADLLAAVRYESQQNSWDVAFIALTEPEFEGRHRFEFSAERTIRVGHQVVFIGYPFQMSNITCHSGYVSSLFERNGVSFIQIDGSVNGGNSGGPLLDLTDGSVIGIITRAHVGFVAEQFDNLIGALRNNVEVLSNQRALISIGGVDPVQAIHASQSAMIEIASSLRSSANVGIGYAFDSSHIRDAIADLPRNA